MILPIQLRIVGFEKKHACMHLRCYPINYNVRMHRLQVNLPIATLKHDDDANQKFSLVCSSFQSPSKKI